MSANNEYKQPSNANFGVLEESLGDLHTGLICVECRHIHSEENIQHVDSKVTVLFARVDEFERSHNVANEMQSQVHEMREDLDCLKGRVDKLKQSVKYQMVGAQIVTSLKDMQDSLDELNQTVTTFRQEISLKLSCKSAWKATYEDRMHALEQDFSWVKGNQARLSDFYETACNDIIKLHETINDLQQCTPSHSHLFDGLKEMKLLFSSLQDKIEELGVEIAWTQTVAPPLPSDLCAIVGEIYLAGKMHQLIRTKHTAMVWIKRAPRFKQLEQQFSTIVAQCNNILWPWVKTVDWPTEFMFHMCTFPLSVQGVASTP
ncbi:hypothetical protein EDD16DRAFT_1526796 [Pisolithus croceorrhizus]|nr:hypothetical protein EV401DRAFT_1895157 [Pisolithus croceorrhizus]KAI6099397.1 hypothetical protein EDD16DRAFT_1526796 [Pisolithus croceorrhizus]KAI6168257.1 hypothetical protein EDD17DRAFT_1503843 [Pisolithus thermaeus]